MTRTRPRFVADVMTSDVLTLSEDEDLTFLEEAMHLFRFRHMPVTDSDHLVGLVSERDLLRISASSLLPSSHQQTEYLQRRFLVRDIMTREVETVRRETPLLDAARLLRQRQVGCLPVVDESNRLVGILTEADFIRLVVELLE